MRKTFCAYRLALSAICMFLVLGSAAYGQERGRALPSHRGLVLDWSRHHVLYTRFGPEKAILAAKRDPRAVDSWEAAVRNDLIRLRQGQGGLGGVGRGRKSTLTAAHRDWSINLGTGGTAATMYPAKYTFYPNATPSCANDFIVFPVNVTGTTTQPNIVGLNNLYSGTAGATGACNRATTASDDGVSATTYWSYNVQGIAGGGSVPSSPALSMDGAKVAFVESKTGNAAHFHVLAWKINDGQDPTNLQENVLAPTTISSFATTAPVEGSGTATDLVLGATTSTLSSPFIDFANDLAYVGNDAGILYRLKDVFCTDDPACLGGAPPVPSIDTTWGTSGSVTVCSGVLTAPVLDSVTGNIFVGCSDGKLYGFSPTGNPLAHSPVTVGDGTALGGIVDPPLIDVINGFVYVASGSSAGGTQVIVQAKTLDLSSAVTATLGEGGQFNMHAPAFNDAYFSSPTSTNWLLYDFGMDTPADFGGAAGQHPAIYAIGFDSSHNMTAGTPVDYTVYGAAVPLEFTPLTEFLNAGTDQLFFGVIYPNFNVLAYAINSFATVAAYGDLSEGNGPTGIVVDNVSTEGQASSIYFGTLNGASPGNTAVKLTQAGLE